MPRRSSQKRTPIGVRLTDEAYGLLMAMAAKYGVTFTAIIEMSIRYKAEAEGITPPPQSKE